MDTNHNSPGLIVLQWLTYAFWGWTIVLVTILFGMIFSNFFVEADTSSAIPYVIAGVLVLAPLSIVCDLVYRRREPAKKAGASMVIMVVHAVIFALTAIGSLILAVFSLVQLLIGSVDSGGTSSVLYSMLIAAVLFGALFFRTLSPIRAKMTSLVFTLFMAVVVVTAMILGIAGPVAAAQLVKNDKRIETNLPTINQAIISYASANEKLPANLSELSLRGEAKAIVTENLVRYVPEGSVTVTPEIMANGSSGASGSAITDLKYPLTPSSTVFRYQLCVSYKKASLYSRPTTAYDSPVAEASYDTYFSTYAHPAGDVCYKLQTYQ